MDEEKSFSRWVEIIGDNCSDSVRLSTPFSPTIFGAIAISINHDNNAGEFVRLTYYDVGEKIHLQRFDFWEHGWYFAHLRIKPNYTHIYHPGIDRLLWFNLLNDDHKKSLRLLSDSEVTALQFGLL